MTIIKNINPVKNLARALRARRAFGRAIFNGVKENRGRVTLASLLIVSVLVLTGGLYYVNSTKAAALTSIKDTLSTPAPGVVANHDIQFTSPTGAAGGNTITVTFPAGFNMGTVAFGDMDLKDDGVDITLAATCATTTWGAAVAGQVITFTSCTGTIAAASVIRILIGTNATGGTNQITNPTKVAAAGTADIYSITIGGTFTDTGSALIAIIEGVTVSVTVDQSLSFSIAGVTNTSCTEGGTATQVTTTVTTVPFGTSGLAVNTFYKGCHDLTISTNAPGGYAITSEENTSLLRTGADSADKTLNDAICDAGPCTSVIGATTTTAWATASANHGFGYTCNGGGCNAEFTGATEFNAFACRSAVAASCDPVDGPLALATPISAATPVSAQVSRIVYKLSFAGVQPAGAYSNAITYIATPTF